MRGGSKPGERRGGRKKGTANKSSLPLLEKANALGIDPFEILLYFAKGDWKKLGYSKGKRKVSAGMTTIMVDVIEPELRASAAKSACEYIHPKRKALDISSTNPILSGAEKITLDLRWADETDFEDEEEDAASKEDK